jgi:hypothetical protein
MDDAMISLSDAELEALGLAPSTRLEPVQSASAPPDATGAGFSGEVVARSLATLAPLFFALAPVGSVGRGEGVATIARSERAAGLYALERAGLEIVGRSGDPGRILEDREEGRLLVDARGGRVALRVRSEGIESVLVFEQGAFARLDIDGPSLAPPTVEALAPPIEALVGDARDDDYEGCEPWLLRRFASPEAHAGYGAIEAVAVVGRSWRTTRPGGRARLVTRIDAGNDPWTRCSRWFASLDATAVDAVLERAHAEALDLRAGFDRVLDLGGGDREEGRRVARRWLERRDTLAAVSELAATHPRGRGEAKARLDALLVAIDREARGHTLAWRLLGRVPSPQLAASALNDAGAWWGELVEWGHAGGEEA